MRSLTSMRRLPRLAVAMAVVAVAGIVVAVAVAANPSTDRSFTPQKADQVTNIDVLRQQIANYYGDPRRRACSPLTRTTRGRRSRSRKDGGNWLAARARCPPGPSCSTSTTRRSRPGTTRSSRTGPSTRRRTAQFVTDQLFPAVPGMVDMVNRAAGEGYAIFYLTGRPQAQEAATLGNLTSDGVGVDAGYSAPTDLSATEDGLFTKPPIGSYPAYLDKPEFCGPSIHATPAVSCPTIQYKSGVRAHIERLGLRDRRELRRPVQRPRGRVRRQDVQAAEPELLPAVGRRTVGGVLRGASHTIRIVPRRRVPCGTCGRAARIAARCAEFVPSPVDGSPTSGADVT